MLDNYGLVKEATITAALVPSGQRCESRALLPTITVWAFTTDVANMPTADFCCEIRAPCGAPSHESATRNRSPDVSSTAFRTQPPDLQPVSLIDMDFDGYGLRCQWPACPTPYASDPVLVHRLVRLLHASFRPRLGTTPLRFAMTSPPSGCQRDFHPRAVEHARHTTEKANSSIEKLASPRYRLGDWTAPLTHFCVVPSRLLNM
jgi:hypothetical protein